METNSEELNCIAHSHPLNLVATGGIDGVTEFWSLDSKQPVASIPNKNQLGLGKESSAEVTALAFSDDGMRIAIGNEEGTVKIFDIRYPIPQYTV
jgi:ribosome biogenesis protein ENP2